MPSALLAIYFVVEILAFVAVGSWIGFGWALLALGGLFFAGVLIASVEVRRLTERAMADAREVSDMRDEEQARRALASAGTMVADSAMLMVGSVLLALPGFVTSVLGLLCIIPPTRAVLKKIGGGAMLAWFEKMSTDGMIIVQRRGVSFPGAPGTGGFGGPAGADRSGDPRVVEHEAIEDIDTSFFENLEPEDFTKGTDGDGGSGTDGGDASTGGSANGDGTDTGTKGNGTDAGADGNGDAGAPGKGR